MIEMVKDFFIRKGRSVARCPKPQRIYPLNNSKALFNNSSDLA